MAATDGQRDVMVQVQKTLHQAAEGGLPQLRGGRCRPSLNLTPAASN
jgi:hypothetical protein